MITSSSIEKIAPAILAIQGAVGTVPRKSWNPHFKSWYAGLDAVWEAARPALQANGVSLLQFPVHSDKGIGLETVLLHVSGEFISSTSSSPLQKQDAQGVGSAITYLRRYGLAAVLGIVPDPDDDGEAASEPATKGTVWTGIRGDQAQTVVSNSHTVIKPVVAKPVINPDAANGAENW